MNVQVGLRLEEERKRLGFTQDQMAGLGGVAKRTYCNYEAGTREPGAGLLSGLGKIGADVQYIITGQHSTQALSQDEEQLISLFRAAPLAVKAATMAGLVAGGAPMAGSATNTNSGDGVQQNFVGSTVGKVVTGDITIGKGKKR
ncbi:helix-turn-helix domain-containing protein [Aeromonas hydrophila]|uniref:helix-turn-helix domain-containing protein n=1 Tax=Aeromonas hydrophila TaxID=644 RepID=UPI000574D4F2|nr:helix-turn-helix transcriptional regulator [Aeromonas hydrophila]KHN59603.1 hypothetical protein OI72_05510 [Aeromonas hydrophila]OFC44873.1 hypothetical protein BA189_17385 [Aeromonas hydrophila]OFC51575.1 hypothetical protein BA188_15610 [Aeromonas hydrophila]